MPGRSIRVRSSRPTPAMRPRRCSTVTPGKLATFWWRPVRRLKRVDLPEFGGPISTTVRSSPCRGGAVGGTKGGGVQQLLIAQPRAAREGLPPPGMSRSSAGLMRMASAVSWRRAISMPSTP